jgi:dihydrofolate reductase
MKCSVFIATSADGFIATPNGGVDWLDAAGNSDADMGDEQDMGIVDFLAAIDCMIIGRKSLEKLASFKLTAEQWPYGSVRIIALSHTLAKVPENLPATVELSSLAIEDLITKLEAEGHQHAYIDGGQTICQFLNAGLINEMTITQAPVLLAGGIDLFAKLEKKLALKTLSAKAYPNDFVQIKYQVQYN